MARPTLARRLGTASLLAALALTTAACGSDSASETSSGADTSETGEESSAEETAQETAQETAESSGDLGELEAAEFYPAVMEALQEAETFAFTLSTSTEGSDAGALEMEGVMRYDADGIDLSATGSGQGAEKLEMIMLDKVLYMTGIGMAAGGKKWLKIDLRDPDSLFGMLGKATDPELMFKAMEEPKEFELVGSEELDGVETNRYRVVMDTAAYVEAMDMPAELTTAMPEDIGMEMWIDADNLPRKFQQELEMSAMAGDQTSGVTSTTEGTYSDYGTEVSIEAPPPSEVSDTMPGM